MVTKKWALATQLCPRTSLVRASPPNYLRRCRRWLPRSPIGRSGPPDLDHARLHLACTLPFYNLRDLPGATIQELGGELIISYNIKSQWSGSERRRGGWVRLRGCSGSEALGRGLPWALRGIQNSESGARALRKYAYDATAIWETVHVDVKPKRKAIKGDSLSSRTAHTSAKRALQRSTLMEGYVGYPPRPDGMHPIGSCVLRGAGCHECENHNLYEAPRHSRM
eukprot:516432-Pleurochrysis_carterae.AAC.1